MKRINIVYKSLMLVMKIIYLQKLFYTGLSADVLKSKQCVTISSITLETEMGYGSSKAFRSI